MIYNAILGSMLAAAAMSASAQDFSASVGVESEYVSRGRDLSNDSVSYNAMARVDNLFVNGLFAEFEANTVWGHPSLINYDPVRTEYEVGYKHTWNDVTLTGSLAHTRKSLFYSYLPINEARLRVDYNANSNLDVYGFVYRNLSNFNVPTDTYYGAGVNYNVTSRLDVGAEVNAYNYSTNDLAVVDNVLNAVQLTTAYKINDNLVFNAQYAYVNKDLVNVDLPNQFSFGLKYNF